MVTAPHRTTLLLVPRRITVISRLRVELEPTPDIANQDAEETIDYQIHVG